MLKSTLTGEYFDEKGVIRIVNAKQAAEYWGTHGIKPVSIYPSKNLTTGEPLIVFLFDINKTKGAYEAWKNKRR